MQRKQDSLVPIGEGIADLPGSFQARGRSLPARRDFHSLRSGEPVGLGQRRVHRLAYVDIDLSASGHPAVSSEPSPKSDFWCSASLTYDSVGGSKTQAVGL